MFVVKIIVTTACITLCLATIPRPRGVAISMASFYKPGVPFKCLDQTKEIPFEYVNDDYCDCPDGSDEPGTSACPNGKFHCTNAGYRPLNVLSSRVNDGICDCCDGTDEWEGSIECVNNCKDLGKQMREEADRIKQLQEQGYKIKLQYIEDGKKSKEEKKVELVELEREKTQLETVKSEMETKKTNAETPEKEAKEKHEQAWNEEVERKKAEKQKLQAEIVFNELDVNKDNRLGLEEIKSQLQFDVDSNGEVSDDEAREHLEGEEWSDLAHFMEKVWPNIMEFYKPGGDDPSKGDNDADATSPPPPKAHFDLPDDDEYNEAEDDDDYGDDDDEILDDEYEEEEVKDEVVDEEEKMPDYDEATKQLIADADEARNQFDDAEKKLKEAENKMNDINNYLRNDYGPEEEYSMLKGNCYEFTDREYTYKLCGFERATQRSKSGGSETTLGNWGRWDGPDHDKYGAQLYDNGQNCWNGPNRSVKVTFKCGLENKVTSASEPSRCEYAFDFETPSRCIAMPATNTDDHVHTEL